MQKKIIICLLIFITSKTNAQQNNSFNGIDVNMDNLYRLSHAKSRSISPENFSGAKGEGAKAITGTGSNAARDLGKGWKISPSVVIK
jgi:hypothetical protein